MDPSLDLYPDLTFIFHPQFILLHLIPPRLTSSPQLYLLSCSPHLNSLPLYPTLRKALDSWFGLVLDLTLRSSPSPPSQLISPYLASPHLSPLPPVLLRPLPRHLTPLTSSSSKTRFNHVHSSFLISGAFVAPGVRVWRFAGTRVS